MFKILNKCVAKSDYLLYEYHNICTFVWECIHKLIIGQQFDKHVFKDEISVI